MEVLDLGRSGPVEPVAQREGERASGAGLGQLQPLRLPGGAQHAVVQARPKEALASRPKALQGDVEAGLEVGGGDLLG